MVVLADTSVWIDHFRRGNRNLAALLENNNVAMHPFILGDLACGNFKERETALRFLSDLNQVEQASHHEVLFLIEKKNLMGNGVGYIDFHLLASAMISGIDLWTLDKRLREIARSLGLSWIP